MPMLLKIGNDCVLGVRVACVAQALALAFRPRYANGHAVRTTL
ncbi:MULTISPECIES: hypothetical protein [unclassified Moorena]|nr:MULTISPECIES: hypothetical protein [unclassified Moorena]